MAAPYYALQGLLTLLWWLLLFLNPATRAHFQPPGSPTRDLLAFWLPDLLLVGLGSLAAGYLRARGSRSAPFLLWFVAGGMSYATLYCLALSLGTGAAWAGVVLMVPAMLLSLLFAASASRSGER